MNILLLGGPLFLGRAIIDTAQQRGHGITLFNRGRTNADNYPDVPRLIGDRRTDLSALSTGRWDVAIDTSAYFPDSVAQSARLLADRVEHYTFVSSISVYSDNSVIGMDESAPLATTDDPHAQEVTGENYGPLKALCEAAAEAAMPGRTCVVRPGLIVGPHDPSDRFTYWPTRIARGGDVLAPGRPQRAIQFIDVRDLAEWIVTLAERRVTGVFNATGFDRTVTMQELLKECVLVSGSEGKLHWIGDRMLLKHNVGAWMEMPLWLPEDEPTTKGFFTVSNAKAMAAGLTFRPLADTVRATLEWYAAMPARPWRAGLAAEKERAILVAVGALG